MASSPESTPGAGPGQGPEPTTPTSPPAPAGDAARDPEARRRFSRNVAWNYASGLAGIVGLVLLYPVAVQLAGARAYGLWVLAFGATQLLVMTDFGIGDGIVRRMGALARGGADRGELRRFVGVAVGLFAVLAAVLVLAYLVLVPLYLRTVPGATDDAGTARYVVVAGALALALAVAARGTNAVLWAQDRQDIERKATFAGLGVRIAGYGLAAATGTGLLGVVAAEVAGAAVSPIVCSIAVARRFGAPSLSPRAWSAGFAEHGRGLVRLSLGLFVGSLASLLTFQAPLFLVGTSLGLVAATAFGAVMRVYSSARMVDSWTANPFIHAISSTPAPELPGRVRACAGATLVVGTGLAVVVSALAPDIVVAWLGETFLFAAPALTVVGLGMIADALVKPAALVGNLRGTPLHVSALHVVVLVVTLVAVSVATTSGNLTAIVLASTAAPLVCAPLYLLLARRVLGSSPLPRLGARWLLAIAAAAALYAAVYAVGAALPPWPAVLVVAAAGLTVLGGGGLVFRRRRRAAAATS